MTLDPGAPGGSGCTFGLSLVVSAMLSDVVSACVCGLYGVVCVAGAPMCIPDTFFFACGGTLGHSDVLVGPPVFLLGVGKKVISLQVPFGLLIFGLNCTRAIIITFLLYIKSTGACMSCVFLILTYFYYGFDLP